MPLIAEIVLADAIGSFDKKYSYLVPENLIGRVVQGCRVTVPFGRANILKQGMVVRVNETEDVPKTFKSVAELIDDEPILNDEMLKMCLWMKEQTFCTYYDAVKAMLPAGLGYKFSAVYSVNKEFVSISLLSEKEKAVYDFIAACGECDAQRLEKNFCDFKDIISSLNEKEAVLFNNTLIRRLGDATRKYLKLCDDVNLSDAKLTERQREIAELVAISGSVSIKEIQYFTGVTLSVINSLAKKGIIEIFDKEEFRTPYKLGRIENRTPINLTDEQSIAYSGLKAEMLSGEAHTSLLYGVTGSGKTQVFLKLVDDAVDSNKGVIIMVPEIALTPQMIEIFSHRYGDKIAIFHSAMSLGKRMDEYKRIKQGRALIAIGTRSAVFAPFNDLGLIIIDEEQEHTYKSEKSPRFHTRDLARFRAKYHKALLCLASATPSMETYSAAINGRYGLYTLKNRYGSAVLPDVSVVDMRKEAQDGNRSSISRELADSIEKELKEKKQVILLLNRRGHNTYVSCPACGYVSTCPNCSVSLTYHSANGRLMCHYCGYSEPVAKKCPECDCETMRFSGAGTQKLEEELNLLFPEARVLRLDADSTMARDSYQTHLTAFANGEYDILLGTQMVAKGLDFPKVSLVGVIGADQALYSDDYRGFERTFSLLTQVVGRAGRSGGTSKAIIQTNDPTNNIIELAKNQDYESFYNSEILTRKLMIFPPFCDICQLSVSSSNREIAESTINEILSNIKNLVDGDFKDIKLIILGPTPAVVPKVNNKYRFRMLIKCKNNARFREMLNIATDIKFKQDAVFAIDFNPESVI